MKKGYRFLAILLVIVMLATNVSAAEQEEAEPYASLFFTMTDTYLYGQNGNMFRIWSEVLAKARMDVLGISTIKVQQSPTGTSPWTTVRTFSSSSITSMLANDAVYHDYDVGYAGVYGYYYRAYITFYAEDDGNTGEYSRYTDILHLTNPNG